MVDQVIKLKRNTSNTTAPTTSDIVVGEIAVSAVDGKLYIRKQDDSIKAIDANEDDVIALAIALG
jgi:DNA-binding beta-propeller fold protein YncE